MVLRVQVVTRFAQWRIEGADAAKIEIPKTGSSCTSAAVASLCTGTIMTLS